LTELRRDNVPIKTLTESHLLAVLELVTEGELAKEGVGEVLSVLAESPDITASQAIKEAGLSGVDRSEVRAAVIDVIDRNKTQVEEQGMGAFSALMGEAMGALRGKADGEIVSEVLREEISNRN
jgi:glutamyl-tRNA(Gln) amidotransferase subunit E